MQISFVPANAISLFCVHSTVLHASLMRYRRARHRVNLGRTVRQCLQAVTPQEA